MLKYWLEFEESIGRIWDKFLYEKVQKFHEDKRVHFKDISRLLLIFHHLMGGEKGKELQITNKRYMEILSRPFLEKMAFMGKEFYLTWQDEQAIYLPSSFAYFPDKKQNEMLY